MMLVEKMYDQIELITKKIYLQTMEIKENQAIINIKEGIITDIVRHYNQPQQIVISSSSGEIHFIKTQPFTHKKSIRVFKEYATSILSFVRGICVGSRNGNFAFLNGEAEITLTSKLSEDCISSIVESEQYIVTTSYDGKIRFLDKQKLEIQHTIDLDIPIMKAVQFQNKVFTCGNPSYRIICSTLEIQKLKRFDYFASYNRKFYGCSDERGLTCISTNSNSYIPCNLVFAMKDKMVIISDQCIGEFTHSDHMQWKCHKTTKIKNGGILIGGCVVNDQLFLGDQMGKIYKISFIDNANRRQDQKILTQSGNQ